MDSQMANTVQDQIVSAMVLVKDYAEGVKPLEIARELSSRFLDWFRRYWYWLFYLVLLRKMLRMAYRYGRIKPKGKRSKGKKNRADATMSISNDISSTSGSTEASSSYFTSSSLPTIGTPATNQVVVGDGVIVINRNDRYVEVYERKNVSIVDDDVDQQIKELLEEFASRNRNRSAIDQ